MAGALAAVDVRKVHGLHMVQSGVVLPEHLDVFETGVARRLDYAFSGPQSARIARLLFGGKIELGAGPYLPGAFCPLFRRISLRKLRSSWP